MSDYQKLLINYNKLKEYVKDLEKENKQLIKDKEKLNKDINDLYLLLVVKVDKEVNKNKKSIKRLS